MSISISLHFMANPYIYINNNQHKLIMVGVFVDDGLGHCAYTSNLQAMIHTLNKIFNVIYINLVYCYLRIPLFLVKSIVH